MCQANNRNFVFAPRAKESFHQMQNNPNPQLLVLNGCVLDANERVSDRYNL